MTHKSKIKINNLEKTFSTRKTVTALQNVNFEVKEGEFAVILGPSGCGKSTMLYLIAGFEKPTKGTITLDDKIITKPDSDRGFVFQDFALYPWRTVLKNVTFGLEMKKTPKEKAEQEAKKYIDMVGLDG